MLNNNDMNYKRFVVTELKVSYSKAVKKFPEEFGVFPFYPLWMSSRQSLRAFTCTRIKKSLSILKAIEIKGS